MYKPPQTKHRYFHRILQTAAVCAVLLVLFGLAVIAPAPQGLQAQVAEKTKLATTPSPMTQIVYLEHNDAQDVLNVLGNILSDIDLRVAVDRNTNSVILRGSEVALQEAIELIRQIDQPPDPNRRRDPSAEGRPLSSSEFAPRPRTGGSRRGGGRAVAEETTGRSFGFSTGRRNNLFGSAGGVVGGTGLPGGYGAGGTGGIYGGSPFGPGGNAFFAPAGSTPESQAIAAEIANLEQQTAVIVQDYRAHKDSLDTVAREDITKQVRQLAEQAFDKRLAMQEIEVAYLEKRLEKVKASMARRRELRDRIIAKRVDDLISDDDLRWDSASTPGGGASYGAAPAANTGGFDPYFFGIFGTGPASDTSLPATNSGTTPPSDSAGDEPAQPK